jgi:hypothetical protein
MNVQFLKNTATAQIDYPENTLLIYRDGFGYDLPDLPGVEYIEFLDYKARYTTFDPELIVVIGLNRIITPSNRCDMVNEYLQTMTPSTPKMCVDTAPFIGEPWRLWFHYSIANAGRFNVPYSYVIETEWLNWFYRDTNYCRLSGDNIKLFITDTASDLDAYHTDFTLRDVTEEEERWYKWTKSQVFEKYDTPKLLINNMLKLSNKYYGLDIGYDSFKTNEKLIVPDVGVYRFVVEEAKRRMAIYNAVVTYETIQQ